jgi:two-component system, NarL family, response regulator DevR
MINQVDIALFVVEDSKLVSFAIHKTLADVHDFNIVGFAQNGETAVRRILELKPDIALIDLGLPDFNGIEVIRRVKERLARLKVIVLTASETIEDIVDSLSAGADGYVLKEVFGERLELAIRSVRSGAVWLDPGIARRLLQLAQSGKARETEMGTKPLLTNDEVALLGAVAESQCTDGLCLIEPKFLEKVHHSLIEQSETKKREY